MKNKEINYCGFGKSIFLRPPYWSFHNASCKIHDDNYEKGGTRLDRLTADVGFLWRMCQDSNEQTEYKKKRAAVYSAIIYFLLVRLFGWIPFFCVNWLKNKLGIKKDINLSTIDTPQKE